MIMGDSSSRGVPVGGAQATDLVAEAEPVEQGTEGPQGAQDEGLGGGLANPGRDGMGYK